MNSLRNFWLFTISVAVLTGCQTSGPQKVALEDARKLTVNFKSYEVASLSRTIADHRKVFEGSLIKFKDACVKERKEREEDFQEALSSLGGLQNSDNFAAARLTFDIEKQFTFGNFKTAIQAARVANAKLDGRRMTTRQAVLTTAGTNAGECWGLCGR